MYKKVCDNKQKKMCSSKSHRRYEFEKKEGSYEFSCKTGELGSSFVRVFSYFVTGFVQDNDKKYYK